MGATSFHLLTVTALIAFCFLGSVKSWSNHDPPVCNKLQGTTFKGVQNIANLTPLDRVVTEPGASAAQSFSAMRSNFRDGNYDQVDVNAQFSTYVENGHAKTNATFSIWQNNAEMYKAIGGDYKVFAFAVRDSFGNAALYDFHHVTSCKADIPHAGLWGVDVKNVLLVGAAAIA